MSKLDVTILLSLMIKHTSNNIWRGVPVRIPLMIDGVSRDYHFNLGSQKLEPRVDFDWNMCPQSLQVQYYPNNSHKWVGAAPRLVSPFKGKKNLIYSKADRYLFFLLCLVLLLELCTLMCKRIHPFMSFLLNNLTRVKVGLSRNLLDHNRQCFNGTNFYGLEM